jgi:hypothetical protein
MLRGVRIDLAEARRAWDRLEAPYVRDAHAGTLSDEAIGLVNTVIRSLEGALGKTAHGVAVRYSSGRRNAYFPLTADPGRFGELLEQNIPGLAVSRPDIADAFERYQPYHSGREELRYLKQLYRATHHHDFVLQEKRDNLFIGWQIGPARIGEMTVGADPGWPGVPVARSLGDIAVVSAQPAQFGLWRWVDWYFEDPNVSVAGTLRRLCPLVVLACRDIAAIAGLES